ncbi:N-acyl homoserine lactonase family protein [Bradyrhizobium sp. U87765 SZCCT0131]|uniref:AttM family quorum-quenching N-acyl homoserine lactonase n=1 Tax=unclassified Bradyrhizobium TaxID=2631580 RepID=UPI001BAE4DBA|nr:MULTISPECIES: N-acyl homoserine lactonase family protein [unclassified Bradyrhizobium]MBR1221767.1 N-acyl homoserine lactonase family protein [Bradyrhizobium sp. U87765 SZCCT0131]MBR1264035.1 N-acyl homoserine lactonase family protein [Bradyrhizobium sp. U87765 SZCCT0134]MBR1308182.1 N-acyl homoserine lactonase family protein [Bradyrhizobium sp. U87765 SZCCT0110]MBR1320285.1 N-acyl homoserine lactonase family protein [Bradyrhizobium sp. U87765 SZCCT0109]MBR1348602.1 N-acyl homoserine lacton
MSAIRLYMLQSGTQHCKVHDIRMNQGGGADLEIPVPWFLLMHPRGPVVLDGGLAAEGLDDPRGYWGASVDVFRTQMTREQGCVAALAALGIAPADIRYVVLSHLHSDHTGAIGRFPRATHIVQRREYDYAFAPDWFAVAAYCRRDVDRSGLAWRLLDGEAADDCDLLGDGTLRLVFTPGHSVGHQSFVVTLPRSGPLLLTADAAYTMDHWHERALPGFMTSAVEAVRSVRKLRALAERLGARVIPGHDPEAWAGVRHAPAFYD